MKSHETRIDLQANAKAASIDLLNSRLAYAIDLALVTKQAQWNLKGIQFIGVREMLGTFRGTLVRISAFRIRSRSESTRGPRRRGVTF
jgi:starvation-inducible DNA-binding protein